MTRKQQIANQILEANLQMPNIPALRKLATSEEYSPVEQMFQSAFKTYINKGSHLNPKGQPVNTIAMPYWAQQIANPKIHNLALKILSKSGWLTVDTRPNNNWSDAYLNESKLLEYVSAEALANMRLHNKFKDFTLTYHNPEHTPAQSKSTKFKELTRVGFDKTAFVPFQFDTATMAQFKDVVTDAVNKGISKMIQKYPQITKDHANYRELGSEIVESYINYPSTYNSGSHRIDRGRNIAGYLDRIGNPVGFKVMRSLLVIPSEYRNTATKRGLYNKFGFIAQLLGFKNGTEQDKIDMGKQAYFKSKFHECDYSEETAEEIFENIWLERLYTDIDNYFGGDTFQLRIKKQRADLSELTPLINHNYKWEVPVEIDMSASVLGYFGLLLNHKPFLDRCNITHGILTDAWSHDTITNRKQFKTIMRQCYGSQLSAEDMWSAMDIPFTQEEVDAFNYEMEHGDIAPAIAFKDFIINNCQMKEHMTVHIGDEKFKIQCNRYHNVGETTYVYDLYNTATDSIRTIHNTQTRRVADLKSFKRYSVTCPIHNLDGQVMNNTADAVINQYGWMLDIHDAAILCCEAVDYAREIYANGKTPAEPSLKYVHTNRKSILQNYFRSINIPASAQKEWKKLQELIIPFDGELEINPLVLK